MLNPNFVIVGVFLQSLGGISYLVDTIKGKVQPNRVSWFLWAVAPLIAFTAQIQQGVGIQSLATFIVGFIPLVIFIASFVNKEAEWKITRLDMICGLLSVGGLILWYITKVGNVAILFAILADGLAAIPTIVKSYYYPETENASVYLFGIINAGIAILAAQNLRFESLGFPIYLFLVTIVISFLIKSKIGKKFDSPQP